MEKLEELIDRVKVTPPGEARRAYLLELAAAVTADVRAADFADGHGGRDLLLKSMDGAMRVGDEELMDAVGAADHLVIKLPLTRDGVVAVTISVARHDARGDTARATTRAHRRLT